MTSHLSWERVINNDMDRLEFGACHVNLAWRRHRSSKAKFLGLRSAFVDSPHRLPILLQEVGANVNARNYPERGQAVFAAVWSARGDWAILCDATHAALVPKTALEGIPQTNRKDEAIVKELRALMETTPENLRCMLDAAFLERFTD